MDSNECQMQPLDLSMPERHNKRRRFPSPQDKQLVSVSESESPLISSAINLAQDRRSPTYSPDERLSDSDDSPVAPLRIGKQRFDCAPARKRFLNKYFHKEKGN